MLRKLILPGFLVLYAQLLSATGMEWNLNDVSYLFALPEGNAQVSVNLLGPQDRTGSGPLLPRKLYEKLPTLLTDGAGNETLYKKALRVVGARIDPCPNMETTACSPELRLIWQPVEYDEFARKWLARDAAVHSFYRLSSSDLALLKQDLWSLKKKFAALGVDTRLKALDIHPALKDEHTAESFNLDIQHTLLKYTSHSKLDKFTYVALLVPKRWWRFGIFEKNRNGDWQTPSIPRLETPTEDIFNVAVHDGIGLGPEKGVDAVFNVLPEDYPAEDNIFPVINKGYRFNDARDQTVFRGKLDVIARFQNPHQTNANNLDCASCHYADATKYYMANRFPDLNQAISPQRYENPAPAVFNLENKSVAPRSARNVRAFGFFQDKPVISQRTINESAVAAHWLNTH